MAYGILKVDTITFTDGGVDKSVPVSGLVLNPTFTGNVTVTGTISGNIIQGGTTVSGLTVTGTTANFASGVFTTQVSGLLITGPTVSATTGTFTSLTGTTTNGTTASFTTGNFTSLTGTTTTGTTANFASGVFTTQVSGLLITGPTVSATTGTFTSLTGTTTTGTTANFASGVFTTQISGVTITGTTVSTTTGNFTSLTGTTATITSGIIASGTDALPSLAILSDPNTGIYSPGADQLAVATNGTGRVFVDATGNINLAWGTPRVAAIFDNDYRHGLQFNTATRTLNLFSTTFDSGGVIAFSTRNASGSSDTDYGTERLRITSTGEFIFKGAGTTPGTDKAVYFSGSAPVDSVVLDSSGRLGIGTSSPSADGPLTLTNSTTTNPTIFFERESTNYNGAIQCSAFGTITFYNGADSSSVSGLTPRMTIDGQYGRVGIGSTGPAFPLHISTGDTSSISEPTAGTFGLYIQQNTSGSKGGLCIQDGASNSGPALNVVDNGNNSRFIIDGNGNVGIGDPTPSYQLELSTDSAAKPSTNTWTIASDERIKEDIELADLDLCYQAVKNIPLKRFKWKDEIYTEKQVKDRRKLGWIAQDVEAIFPKAVGSREFKYNQVFEERLIPAVEEVLDDEGNVTTPAQPERIEKGELISEDVIEDCRDLNSDQLYAAMYGAIQKLMLKVETLEIEVASLKAS